MERLDRHGVRDSRLDAGKHRREERPLPFGRRPVRRREQRHVVLERPTLLWSTPTIA